MKTSPLSIKRCSDSMHNGAYAAKKKKTWVAAAASASSAAAADADAEYASAAAAAAAASPSATGTRIPGASSNAADVTDSTAVTPSPAKTGSTNKKPSGDDKELSDDELAHDHDSNEREYEHNPDVEAGPNDEEKVTYDDDVAADVAADVDVAAAEEELNPDEAPAAVEIRTEEAKCTHCASIFDIDGLALGRDYLGCSDCDGLLCPDCVDTADPLPNGKLCVCCGVWFCEGCYFEHERPAVYGEY